MSFSFLKSHEFIWLTDLHLDMVEDKELQVFYRSLKNHPSKGIFITGDIADGENFPKFLEEIQAISKKPLYFVLGNHDYYGNTLQDTFKKASLLSKANKEIHFLPDASCLLDDFALIGINNFNDGEGHDFEKSEIWLRDYNEIEDFKVLSPKDLKDKLTTLGKISCLEVEKKILEAFKKKDIV